MKKTITNLLLIFSGLYASAQQIGMFSHYFYKPMVYNPAFTGAEDGTSMMLVHHNQWSGFKGAPQSNIFTADKNLLNQKMGLGFKLMTDKRGINSRTGGDLFYAYRMNFNGDTRLALGMSFGIFDQALDYSKAIVENSTDPSLFPDSQRKIGYDGNAGFSFNLKGLEFGAAVPHLFGNKIKYSDNASMQAFYTQARHYMTSLKYKFFISKEKGTSLAPQGLVRFVPHAPLQYDANLTFDWKDKFWFGATYKSDYALAVNAGFCILKQFSVGYSYDVITGSIGNYSGLSHEIMLHFQFGKNKNTEPKNKKPEPEVTATEPEPVEPAKDTVAPAEQKPAVVQETKPATKPFDYEAYRKHQLDSIQKAKAAASENSNKVWIGTYKAKDYKDSRNQTSDNGYYVIVGSFLNRDNALAEVKRMTNKGFKSTQWVYSETRKFNYVYISKSATEKEAVKQAVDILGKAAEFEDVWILRLTE